jgi:hypothetical protein
MLRQILTIAEMNGGMNSEDQVKSLKKSVTNIAKNYPPEVLAKFGPDARAFFDLDK